MPTDRFMCPQCGLSTELQLKMSEKDNEELYPECKCGITMERVWISPEGGFILNGGGWFKKGGY